MNLKTTMKAVLLGSLILALTIALLSCAPDSSSKKSGDDVSEEITVSLGMEKSRQVFRMASYLEIDNITLEVLRTDTGVSINTFNLDNATGTWTGVLTGLSINRTYTFIARAYQTGTKIFEGSTNKALQTGANNLQIVMAPTTGSTIVTLPKILRVFRWDPTGAGSSEPVSVVVQSPTGNALNYSFSVDSGGGSYATSTGSLSAVTTVTTVTTNYTAPTNTSVVTQHTFSLTDTQESNSTGSSYSISVDNGSCVIGVSLLTLDNVTSLCTLQ